MRKSVEISRVLEAHLRPHLERHGLSMRITDGELEVFPSWLRHRRRRRPGPGNPPETVPVMPNRPNSLSGGAAAELNFDE